jgi:hypothetical protein
MIKNKDLAGFHSYFSKKCDYYKERINYFDNEMLNIINKRGDFDDFMPLLASYMSSQDELKKANQCVLGSLDMMKLRRSKIINLEELCIEAFKPSRLQNRLITCGEDYEFC